MFSVQTRKRFFEKNAGGMLSEMPEKPPLFWTTFGRVAAPRFVLAIRCAPNV